MVNTLNKVHISEEILGTRETGDHGDKWRCPQQNQSMSMVLPYLGLDCHWKWKPSCHLTKEGNSPAVSWIPSWGSATVWPCYRGQRGHGRIQFEQITCPEWLLKNISGFIYLTCPISPQIPTLSTPHQLLFIYSPPLQTRVTLGCSLPRLHPL